MRPKYSSQKYPLASFNAGGPMTKSGDGNFKFLSLTLTHTITIKNKKKNQLINQQFQTRSIYNYLPPNPSNYPLNRNQGAYTVSPKDRHHHPTPSLFLAFMYSSHHPNPIAQQPFILSHVPKSQPRKFTRACRGCHGPCASCGGCTRQRASWRRCSG